MNYLLVLQFRGDSLADFDAKVALEEQLIDALGDSADVDGHDIGSGEVNIFILTEDPRATFSKARTTIERWGKLGEVTAAYRATEDEEYAVIWPEDSRAGFKVI